MSEMLVRVPWRHMGTSSARLCIITIGDLTARVGKMITAAEEK